MSRVIKLRAWSKTAKIMHPVWERLDDENGEYEIMQFIGLLDKNGKEIYEGDILIGSHESKEVIWNKEELAFWFKGTNWYDGNQLAIGAEYMAVVGNIYENPELLKK